MTEHSDDETETKKPDHRLAYLLEEIDRVRGIASSSDLVLDYLIKHLASRGLIDTHQIGDAIEAGDLANGGTAEEDIPHLQRWVRALHDDPD